MDFGESDAENSQKMTNDQLLLLALVLWSTTQSTWVAQAIYWKSHKANSGW